LTNALKFTPVNGRVAVRAFFADNSCFRLEVEDSGIGIAKDDIQLLFQDFHQLDGGLSKQVQGSGLGLALTKRLVEAQGGRVGVVSVPGKGSTFFAEIPCSFDWIRSDLKALSEVTSLPIERINPTDSQFAVAGQAGQTPVSSSLAFQRGE